MSASAAERDVMMELTGLALAAGVCAYVCVWRDTQGGSVLSFILSGRVKIDWLND